MNFKELDLFFRQEETLNTKLIEEGHYYVVRVDGKGFSKLTEKNFEKPFDYKFHRIMSDIISDVMKNYNLNIVFAYTQSDEISFLLSADVDNRKERKILSIVAGTISALFTKATGIISVFDSRLVKLKSKDDVIRYFVWRMLDCNRNALNTSVYWNLINKDSKSKKRAGTILQNSSYEEKISLLNTLNSLYGTKPYDKEPKWATNGALYYFDTIERIGYNPIKQENVLVERRLLMEHDVNDERDFTSNYLDKVFEKHFDERV